ncbi:TVP38/TMEM64 family protein [Dethiosulfatarculus sandiegensis]|uniref:TVP38/TMEM64 family membrane protein n=1 Tax=Dethiosulfatarculus sandiegensis TaxID=1429043 RepID=A0A0D2HN31_9BACT|nr:TVP38/TMEM64 family protein [Dethiosulfatarculus sandiegensis]KIX11958.1 dihydrolipoamide dehydrogenase [Dethiosulfatarculus sandiegensis]
MKKSTLTKFVISGVLILVLSLFFGLDLHRELTFANLGKLKNQLIGFREANYAFTLAGFFLLYVLVGAFSLPGAGPMTLLGGAIFGFWPALITVSFASTIGATLACFFSRYVLGNWVQKRFSDQIKPINRGMEKDGLLYLFALRLVPVFPFFIINLVMGLTRIKLVSFYWVSQVGMLAGTVVFVNAGAQLGAITSPEDILSPVVAASFAALGLFPLIAKWMLNKIKASKSLDQPNSHGK